MLRPNIVMDAPPTALAVGGLSYNINTDFRIWIDAMTLMKQLIPDFDTEEHIQHNSEIITLLSVLVCGKPIKWDSLEQIVDFLGAASEFLKGYPSAPVQSTGQAEPVQTYSFDYDLNSIAIAFLKYYGVDITYASETKMHWWIFLEYFKNLSGDDLMILKLMSIRGYQGKDKELKKLAARFALPIEHNAAEQEMLDDIADEFYGAV